MDTVDAVASAICEAGRRSRSRSEESPNAVETIPVEEDGVDALMREAATVLGHSLPQVVKRKRHQRTPSLVDAAAVLAGVSETTLLDPTRKEPPPPPPAAVVTPESARPRGRYRCSRCGEPKANHVCKGAQRFERSVVSATPARTAAASTSDGVRWWRLHLTTCGGETSASDCPRTVAASRMSASTPSSSTGIVSTAFGDSSERLRLRRPASQIAEAIASTLSIVLVVSRAGCPLSLAVAAAAPRSLRKVYWGRRPRRRNFTA